MCTEAAAHRQYPARSTNRIVEWRPLRPQAGVDAVVELVRLEDAARPFAGIVRRLPALVHVSLARHDIAAVRGRHAHSGESARRRLDGREAKTSRALLQREHLAIEFRAGEPLVEGAAALRRRSLDGREVDAEITTLGEIALDKAIEHGIDLVDIAVADIDARIDRDRSLVQRFG